ncbi:MAG: DUF2058 family protein [Thiothrix sp.]|nr:DUF2058 family protein [Thiothrix sp.]HPE59121.1 DUF2058 family protein [Thiolinea sp.]
MSNSLSEQLLKAGLITQDQIDKAAQQKQQRREKARTDRTGKPAHKGKSSKPGPVRSGPAAAATPAATAQSPAPEQSKPARPRRKPSDLEQFYKERAELERHEREAEEKRRRELAERKRKTRKQVRELLAGAALNTEGAEIRYNFVVGETIKYLFVTQAQQQQLARGELAITFMDGKRCLIPKTTAAAIHALDPDKLVIFCQDDGSHAEPDFQLPPATGEEDHTLLTEAATVTVSGGADAAVTGTPAAAAADNGTTASPAPGP